MRPPSRIVKWLPGASRIARAGGVRRFRVCVPLFLSVMVVLSVGVCHGTPSAPESPGPDPTHEGTSGAEQPGDGAFGPSPEVAVLLGILQGLTEFLPVSSSGHLVLAQSILGVPEPGITLEVVVHAGTLLAVLLWFRRRVWMLIEGIAALLRSPHMAWQSDARAREVVFVGLATVPVALAGALLRSSIERVFENTATASVCLLATGGFLLASAWLRKRRAFGLRSAVWMGLAQVVSLLPGVSRSGSTIVAGMASGAPPADVVRFSFLMSIPAVAGAVALEAPALAHAFSGSVSSAFWLALASAVGSGLLAIGVLLRVIERGRLWMFGPYCILVGLLGLLLG